VNALTLGFMGIALRVTVVFSLDNQFSVDSLRVAGYKQNNDGYTGIQPLCRHILILVVMEFFWKHTCNAKGDKNIVNIARIIFP
jgi:hypothetical protein